MKIVKIVARLSGIVSYADESHEQFAGHLDERGIVSINCCLINSQRAVSRVDAQSQWLTQMFNQLGGTFTLNTVSTSDHKVVTSLTTQISGHVAYDDNTHGGFIAEYHPEI